MEEQIIACWVENRPGVLSKIANMFRRRGFNIESISAGYSESPNITRITIVVKGDNRLAQQVMKQLNKILEVLRISRLDPERAVIRELALIKVSTSNVKAREELIQYANIFQAKIVDVTRDSTIVEITSNSKKVKAFLELMKDYRITEISRTGITALARGKKTKQGRNET